MANLNPLGPPLGMMLDPLQRTPGMSQEGMENTMRGMGIDQLTPEDFERLLMEVRPPDPRAQMRPGERVPLPQPRGVLEGEAETYRLQPRGLPPMGRIPSPPRQGDYPDFPMPSVRPKGGVRGKDKMETDPFQYPPGQRSEIDPRLLMALFGR